MKKWEKLEKYVERNCDDDYTEEKDVKPWDEAFKMFEEASQENKDLTLTDIEYETPFSIGFFLEDYFDILTDAEAYDQVLYVSNFLLDNFIDSGYFRTEKRLALSKLNRHDEAIEFCKKEILHSKPNDHLMETQLIYAYLDAGKNEDALKLITEHYDYGEEVTEENEIYANALRKYYEKNHMDKDYHKLTKLIKKYEQKVIEKLSHEVEDEDFLW